MLQVGSKGLYRYYRLPLGVKSAPAIFQRIIEGILRGIPHVSVYIDDILVTGETDEEHLRNLDEVFTRLENENLRLKREKRAFMLPKIDYLDRIMLEMLNSNFLSQRAV